MSKYTSTLSGAPYGDGGEAGDDYDTIAEAASDAWTLNPGQSMSLTRESTSEEAARWTCGADGKIYRVCIG